MAIKKIKLPTNSVEDIHDSRISGVDSTPTSGSGNVITSGGTYTALAGKQDTISDLSTIRSGASAGATAYQKPSTGIPASDLAAGVIPTVTPEVLWVTYGTTSFDTIWDAYNDGMIILCKYDDYVYYCIGYSEQGESMDFVCPNGFGYGGGLNYIACIDEQGWDTGSIMLEQATRRVNTVNSSSTYLTYPSTKAVYDAMPAFYTHYGASTYANVIAAHNAGKLVFTKISGSIYILSKVFSSGNILFVSSDDELQLSYYYYYSDEEWEPAGNIRVACQDSPTFTGTPKAPTASTGTNTTQIATTAFVQGEISGKENTSNKVTSLSSSSTDTQYPSAKCVYDLLGDVESLINAL